MIKELSLFIRVLYTPSCWIRNRPTNREWDKKVRQQLKNPKFTNINSYKCNLRDLTIWTENYPYAYGTDDTGRVKGMPSRRTVFKLRNALTKHKMGETE